MKKIRGFCLILIILLVFHVNSNLFPVIQLSFAAQEVPLDLEDAPEHVKEIVRPYITQGAVLTEDQKDDPYTITLKNESGTKTRIAFLEPVKYKNAADKIRFKSDKLKKVENLCSSYALENGENDIDIFFPKKIKDGILMRTKDFSISFWPAVNKNIKAVRKIFTFQHTTEEIVEYSDAFGEGTALQYKPMANGIKENIVLKQYNGQNTFRFYLDFDGLEPACMEGEIIPLLNPETKEMLAFLGQVDVRDSFEVKKEGPEGERHYTLQNYMCLEKDKRGGYHLTLIVDKTFLESKTTVYPVMIDPIIQKTAASIEDTTVYSMSDANYSAHPTLALGNTGAPRGEGRALVKFKDIHSFQDIIPENIIDAHYYAYELSGNQAPATIRLYGTNQHWTSSVTWNQCPDMQKFICDLQLKETYKWYRFPLRELFQDWLRDSRTGANVECSFILTEWHPLEWSMGMRLFTSVQYVPSDRQPYFTVEYDDNTALRTGVFYIKNQQSGKYLDIQNQSTASGANVHQWEFHGGNSQQWLVTKRENGYYTFSPKSAPNLCLVVENNNMENDSNICLLATASTETTRWKLIYNAEYGDSTYRIMSKVSGDSKAMVVYYASTENGANVVQHDYSYLGNRNDDWVFERVDISLPTPYVCQTQSKWCWVASAEMLARTYYLNSPNTQSDAVNYVYGNTINQTGSVFDAKKAANYISGGREFYAADGKIYTPNILTRLLANGHPVLISRMNLNGEIGHTIVAYGFYYTSTDLVIRIKDPDDKIDIITYNKLKNDENYKWNGIVVANVYKSSETVNA